MLNFIENENGIRTLMKVFEDRKSKNSAYSLRAYARDLHISQALITLMVQGRRPLTLRVATKIAPKLMLDLQEENLFLESSREAEAIRENRKRKNTILAS